MTAINEEVLAQSMAEIREDYLRLVYIDPVKMEESLEVLDAVVLALSTYSKDRSGFLAKAGFDGQDYI